MRFLLLPLFAFLALAAPGLADAPNAGGAGIRFQIVAAPDTLAPDESGLWRVDLRVANPLAYGLYLDSLILEVRDLDPGVTRTNTRTTTNLRHLGSTFSTTAAGDSMQFSYSQPASCERGTLVFRWFGHDGAHAAHRASDSVAVGPGEFERAHPSRFLTVGTQRIEIVAVAPADTAKRAPGVLLVHDHGAHARSLLRIAERLSAAGYGVLLVSQPGYGLSTGPPDFMGPATIEALEAALAELRRMPGVDPARLAAWGAVRGATAVMLLAERQPAGLRAVIAQAGLYDLAGWAATTPASEARTRALAEAGASADRWAVRSPLAGVARVRAEVLLVHGRDDEANPIAQPRALAAALRATGARVDTLFVPGGQQAARMVLGRKPLEFLARLSAR